MIRSSHTRRGRAVAAVAVAALAVAATSMGAHASSPPTAPAGSAGGGTLVVGYTADPDTLDPWKATQFQAVNLLQNMYGTLTEFDEDLNVVPGLAEKWRYVRRQQDLDADPPQGREVPRRQAVQLRRRQVTRSSKHPGRGHRGRGGRDGQVHRLEAPDPQTVVLHLSAPDAGLLAGLATANLAMLSKDDTTEAVGTKPNGTGAFAFDQPHRQPVDQAHRQRRLLGRQAEGRRPRVPHHPGPDLGRRRPAVGQRAVRHPQRSARRQDRRGRRRQDDQDAELSYHVLQLNARKAPLDKSTSASPSRAPSTASRCWTPPRSARARSPARSRRRRTSPTRTRGRARPATSTKAAE